MRRTRKVRMQHSNRANHPLICVQFVRSCNAWTWNAGVDQHCWIKTACAAKTGDARYISGVVPSPVPSPAMPSVELRNAAVPGTRYPLIGLGLRGPGYKLGQTQECWRYPDCCTKDYCPAINATRDWLKLGGWRLDTGYPFGDTGGTYDGRTVGPHTPEVSPNRTCGGRSPVHGGRRLGHFCDPHGTRLGIEQSGVDQKDIFITIKSRSSGPMQARAHICTAHHALHSDAKSV